MNHFWYSRNEHNTVNQLYFNKIFFLKGYFSHVKESHWKIMEGYFKYADRFKIWKRKKPSFISI